MRSILVVEDEKHLRDLYTDELEDVGFSVRPAATGREAIESVKKERPDIVVLDIMLDDMEGLEVLDEIKSIDKTIPVIINSAYSVYKSDFSSWMADDYIVKSSDLSILNEKNRRANWRELAILAMQSICSFSSEFPYAFSLLREKKTPS